MSENKINRREAIKAISVAGGLGTISSTGGAVDEEIGSTRLIEVGLEYELNENHNYRIFGGDTARLYRIESDERATITRHAVEEVKSLFMSNNVIVNSDYMGPPPLVTNEIEHTMGLPVSLASRYRTSEFVKLAEEFNPPEVNVSQDRNQIKLTVEDISTEISPGPEQTISLSPREVVAETITVQDERVDDSSLPKPQRSLRTKQGKVSVDATPKVKIRDFGEVTVTSER